MSAKQEFASCPLRLQWEQIIVLSFPSTLPRTSKAITSPLSYFPRAILRSPTTTFILSVSAVYHPTTWGIQ